MDIEVLPVSSLTIDPSNARKHDDKNLQSIQASLDRFGQQKPIVVDISNTVRAGSGTLEAARRLGWETIQCVRSELQGSEATAYAIADNRTTDLSHFDNDILLAQLNGLDYELARCAGYDDADLAALASMDDEPPMDDDDDGAAESYNVTVRCSDSDEQHEVYDRLKDQGYDVKI